MTPLELKLIFTNLVRNFFVQQEFLEVIAPIAVENPGMETHIHPFQLYSAQSKSAKPYYLHTSPEFFLKNLLTQINTEKFKSIFSLGYVFRDEPSSPIHRFQFLMLEWYRTQKRYESIMQDTENLVLHLHHEMAKLQFPLKHKSIHPQKATMQEFILEHTKLDILNFLDKKELKQKIATDYKSIPLPTSDCEWDDYFFLFFLNLVEPFLANYPCLFLHEFPAPLAALSTIKATDSRVCERFELYMDGIEICNAFNELVDPIEQERRFNVQAVLKEQLYKYRLPKPAQFISAMNRGLPPSAGNALGVERLFHVLTGIDSPFIELT